MNDKFVVSTNEIGEIKIKFICEWKCPEEKLLADLRTCETYSEVMEVLYPNMIIGVGDLIE